VGESQETRCKGRSTLNRILESTRCRYPKVRFRVTVSEPLTPPSSHRPHFRAPRATLEPLYHTPRSCSQVKQPPHLATGLCPKLTLMERENPSKILLDFAPGYANSQSTKSTENSKLRSSAPVGVWYCGLHQNMLANMPCKTR
jgi:hypothetical protein